MTEIETPLGLSSRDRDRMEEVQRLAQRGASGVDALVAWLGDPSWVVRRAVVAELARLGAPAAEALCRALTSDRSSETRLAATVDALVASGADVEPTLLAMSKSSQNPAVLCDAAQIFGRRKARSTVSTLAEWVTHSDDNVAVAAIEALGRIGGAAAVEPLLSTVHTKNFFRTFPAIVVLGASGDPRAIEPLVELLGEPHYAAEAASALGRTGQVNAVAPLARLLVHANHGLARAAARALTELRARNVERAGDPDATPNAVRQALKNERNIGSLETPLEGADLQDTIALATVLGWMHRESGVAALLALLDAAPNVAESAVEALRSLGQADDSLLRNAIRTGDSVRRGRLLPLLGARRSVVGDLLVCLDDPDASVRAQACDALARIGDPSVVSKLFALIGDHDPRVSQAAAGAVQSLGSDDAKAHALAAARSTDARTRRAALRILSYFGYPEGLDVLLEAIDDDDERIRDAATSGLALLDDARAAAALLRAAKHSSSQTRAATMRAFGDGPSNPQVVAALRAGLDDADAWVRYYACQSLGKLQVTSAADAIGARMDDDAGQVRVAAVDAIARLGGDHALAVLERASLSNDHDVRRAALIGLGTLRRPGAFPLLLRAAESSDAATRLAALSAIAETGAPGAVSALIRAGTDPDERVRALAFDLLTTRPEPQATRWLIDRLGLPLERDRAIDALAQVVDGRIEGVFAALETSDAMTSAWLLEALLRKRQPTGVAAAEAALHLDNVYARRSAAAALASVGISSAQESLAQAATLDPDPEVRRICAAAI